MKYSEDTFKKLAIVTMLFLAISLIFLTINIVKHWQADYDMARRGKILMIFYTEVVWVFLIMIGLWTYEYADVSFVLIDFLLGIPILYFYIYIKLSLLKFLRGYFVLNSDQLDEFVWSTEHKQIFDPNIAIEEAECSYYPSNAPFMKRVEVLNIATSYCYLLEGKARFCLWYRRAIHSFIDGYKFQRLINILLL